MVTLGAMKFLEGSRAGLLALALAGGLVAACGEQASDTAETPETEQPAEEGTTVTETPEQSLEELATPLPEGAADMIQAEFLEAIEASEAYTPTASGLMYKIIREGTGDSPSRSDLVKVKYRGTLKDGTVFDTTEMPGRGPAEFPVGRLIPGWTEALQLMKEGGIWEVVLPSRIAYGSRGAGAVIGPDEPLIFQLELIEIL